jgi:L-ascorbate metabolism protein UlaG (beta-lactamase superfamily)
MEPGVTVQYFGHACFVVTDSQGTRVAIDPYGEGIGYDVPALAADVCLVTHDHFDHNATEVVDGPPEVVKATGETQVKGLEVLGVPAPHHEPGQDEARGDIVMMRWVMDGITLLHLGDLGAAMTQEQIDALAEPHVLMVPVGGHFTIDASQAIDAILSLQPRVVIPMHYRTDATSPSLPIAPVSDFLSAVPTEWLVSQLETNSITIPRSELEKADAPLKVVVLNYR